VQADGWTIRPDDVQARFAASNGADPIFALVDGANSPTADVSTPDAAHAAYSMLLSKAVIRIGLAMPSTADFSLTTVDDPYGYASAAELSLFRRPLPTTNLKFLTSVLWDGREPTLAMQAIDATGWLDAAGATGGPAALAAVEFTAGENDPFTSGGTPTGAFATYAAWGTGGQANGNGGPGNGGPQTPAERQQAIARGQQIFDTHPIQITNVAGLNDVQGQATIRGTCSTCHDATSAGDHSVTLLLDLGIAASVRRTPDLPLYTFTRTSDGATLQSTDPGLALSTGKFADISKFKVPVLRGLAMRAPYFHNGSAPTLQAVVQFYETRFQLGLSPQDQQDLAAFLSSL
jgi:hypothetical protein